MIRALLTGLLLLLAPLAAAHAEQHVRYDGLYVAAPGGPTDMDYHYFFRLYPDGHVSAVSATGSANEVATWPSPDGEKSQYIRQGEYKISGHSFTAQETGPYGSIDYAGTIRGRRLELDTESHINGHKGHLQFNFVPVGALK